MDDQSAPAQLLDSILSGDRRAATEILFGFFPTHSVPEIMQQYLEPTLAAIGRRWEAEEVSLAQGYVAGKVAEDFLMEAARRQVTAAVTHRPGPVILANAEDDFHPLGRRLVGVFLRLDGWEVLDLGVDVPAEELIDRAVDAEARVVGVSAMMRTTARNILRVRAEIDRRGLRGRIRLAVGGAVFGVRPELVAAVGGDGTAGNALTASALFNTLWRRTEPAV